MQNRIFKALLVIICTIPMQAFALGLGDITVYSALNQPLDAEIDITKAKSSEVQKLIVKLASQQDFVRANIERPFSLTKLTFSPFTKADGQAVIKVKSSNPIREPFLNFLIDAEWPQGRLLREYTILLDPPSFSDGANVAESVVPEAVESFNDGSKAIERPASLEPDTLFNADVIGTDESNNAAELNDAAQTVDAASALMNDELSSEPEVDGALVEQDVLSDVPVLSDNEDVPEVNLSFDDSIPYNADSIINAEKSVLSSEDEALLSAENRYIYREPVKVVEPVVMVSEYTVQSGDVMSNIASQFAPSGADLNQVMMAIMDANPNAFIKNNVNLVKRGKTLKIPTEEEMLAMSKRQAAQEVVAQTALWKEYRQRVMTDISGINDTELVLSDVTPADPGAVQTPSEQIDASSSDNDVQLSLVKPNMDSDSNEAVANVDGASSDSGQKLALAREELSASELKLKDLESELAELKSIDSAAKGLLEVKSQKLAQLQAQSTQNSVQQSPIGEENTTSTGVVNVDSNDVVTSDVMGVSGGSASSVSNSTTIESNSSQGFDSIGDDGNGKSDLPQKVTEKSSGATELDAQNQTDDRPDGIGGFIYDVLPAPLKDIMLPYLSGNVLFAILGGLAALLLLLVWKVLRDRGFGRKDDELRPIDADATMRFEANENASGSVSFLDKIKGLFSKKDPKDDFDDIFEAQASDEEVQDDASDDLSSDLNDGVPDLGLSGGLDDSEKTQVNSVEQMAPPIAASTEATADDDHSDDTTAEADVYLAYGLYDQAEDLLKQAIADNPQQAAYRGKLIETYFNAGKTNELIQEAEQLKSALNGQSSAVWNKAVVLGKEVAPTHALFSGESVSGSVADYEVEKPAEADIDLGDSTGEVEDQAPDFDLGADDDFDLDSNDIELGSDEIDLTAADIQSDDVSADVVPLLDSENDEFDLSDIASELDDSIQAKEQPDDIFSADAEDLSTDLGDLDDLLSDDAGDAEVSLDDESFDVGFDDDSVDLSQNLTDDIMGSESAFEVPMDGAQDDELMSIQDDLESLSSLSFEESELDDESSSFNMAENDLNLDEGIDESIAFGENDFEDANDFNDEVFGSDDVTNMLDVDSMSSPSDFSSDSNVPDTLDEVGTKLDLAKAYIDMEDKEGARLSLEEVLQDGNDAQKAEAQSLLDSL